MSSWKPEISGKPIAEAALFFREKQMALASLQLIR